MDEENVQRRAPLATAGDAGSMEVSTAAEEKIAQCMRMLEGNSDEHKFAGLLMITKLNDLEAEHLAKVRRQVLATVGSSFFLRLLHTRGVTAGAEPTESLSPFQSLGLNLIASFCSDPEVVDEFAQENLAQFIVEQLSVDGCSHDTLVDCVRSLDGLLATEKGTKAVLHESVIGRLFGALKKLSRCHSESDGNQKDPSEGDITGDATIEESLWALMGKISSASGFWSRVHSYDFDFLCSHFSHVGGAVSLRILHVLNDYMSLVEVSNAPVELLTSRCLSDLRSGVLHFLRSKWPHQERDQCLLLVYQLMQHAGTSWMVPGTTLRSQAPPDEVSEGKFVLFLLKLVSIEIKLMLDEVELSLIQIDDTKAADDEESRRKHEVTRALRVLPICYGVVELVISGLVTTEGDNLVLPYDALLQMKTTFADAFAVILELVTLAQEYMQTHRYRDLKASQAPSVYQLDAVVCASIRIVGAWIAEDSDTSVDIVVKLLPFMVCYSPLESPGAQPEAAAATSSVRFEEVDSDDEIDSDDEVDAVAEVVKKAASIEAEDQAIDQLHFLLPGLLQFSALPEGAAVLSDDAEVLRRLMRFTCTICAEIADGNSEYGSISSMTLCLGILINLILVRGGNGEQDESSSLESGLPNGVEWFRSLEFLLPVACASGSRLMSDKDLTMEDRGEDDRYVMLLHVVCVVLFIASHFQDRSRHPTRLPASVGRLVSPFNTVVSWITDHPPDVSSESALDLFELVRVLSLRSLLTPELLSR